MILPIIRGLDTEIILDLFRRRNGQDHREQCIVPMPDSGQLRQLHMREVGRTDAKAFEQGFIQRLEAELMAEKLIFPPQQTIVMAGALFREHTRLSKSIASTCDSLALCFWIYRRGRLSPTTRKRRYSRQSRNYGLIGYRTPRSNPLDTDPADGIYPLSFVPAAH